MALTQRDYRKGARVSVREGAAGTPTSITVAAVANAQTLHTMPTGRTAVIRKLFLANRDAATTIVQIGTGVAGAFVQHLPVITLLGGMEMWLREDDLPCVEFAATITIWASVIGATGVQAVAEVEEYEGPNG